MVSHDTLLLSKEDVLACLDLDRAMQVIRDVYVAHEQGGVVTAPKSVLDLKQVGIAAWTNATPSYYSPSAAAGLKWAGGYAGNPAKGLPYLLALIVLQDPLTGLPLAVMDGGEITAIKTGATAAVCAREFSNPDRNTLTLIGAGVQGTSCAVGVARAVDLAEVRIYDTVQASARRAAERLSREEGVRAHACGSVQEAVQGSSIIVTATQADEPLVKNEWIAPGVTAISIGSWQEFDHAFTLTADKVLVDSYEDCVHRGELAKLIQAARVTQNDLYGTLSEVFAGKKPARTSPDERILIVLVGMGIHDIALARSTYDIAVASGRGTRFAFS